MKSIQNILFLVSFMYLSFFFAGCEVIGDIFKAGIWVGIIIVIAIVAVIGFIFKMFSK